jgi:hypothetical protein
VRQKGILEFHLKIGSGKKNFKEFTELTNVPSKTSYPHTQKKSFIRQCKVQSSIRKSSRTTQKLSYNW